MFDDAYIPKKYWVGYQERKYQPDQYKHYFGKHIDKNGKYKIGYLTKACGGPAQKKEFESKIRSWGCYWGLKVIIDEFENAPMSGYYIVTTARRSETVNGFFQVMSPLGFIIEVSLENMLDILRHTTVVNGMILASCVIAFDGSLRLLTTNSESYKESKAYTEMKDNPIDIKTIKPGTRMRINYNKTKEDVYYLGRYYCYSYKTNDETKYKLAKRSLRHVFASKHWKDEIGWGLLTIAKPNIEHVGEHDKEKEADFVSSFVL